MGQYQARTGPITNNAAPFEPAMAEGWHPDQPRLFSSRNALGLTLSQTTHVQAPLEPSMSAGSMPPQARAWIAPKIPPPFNPTVQTHTQNAFGPEMVAGWHSDTPAKIYLGPKPGWSTSQPTHVAAPVSSEMMAGWHPDTPRLFLVKLGWTDNQLTFNVQMTPEMWAGWHPDQSRAWIAPRIPLPFSETTPIAAPFGVEMVKGWQPSAPVLPFQSKQGWTSNQLTFLVTMTPEMFAGHHPDTARAFLAPRIPLPIAQPTHVSAPFSVEMVTGSKPDQPRPHIVGKLGWVNNQLTFIVQMTPEMFAGWMPARNRERLAPKIPLPISQPTHVAAPFTSSMTDGQKPLTQRTPWKLRQLLTILQAGVIEFGIVIPAGPDEFFIVGAQDRFFVAGAQGRFIAVPAKGTFAVSASGSLVAVPSYASRILSANPIGYWRLNDLSGTVAVDSAASPHNGSYANTPTFNVTGATPGSQTAVTFNGSNQYATVANNGTLNTTFAALTMEAWINTNTLTLPNGHRMLLSLGSLGQTYLSLRQSGSTREPFVSMRIGGVQVFIGSGLAVSTGVWYHVAATYDGSFLRIYVNGVLKNSTPVTGTVDTSIGGNAIADYVAGPVATGWGWSGSLDEVAVYGSALSAATIQAHYETPIAGRYFSVSADEDFEA